MQNIDITDAIKTAYKLQSKFTNSYVELWDDNQWAVDQFRENKCKDIFVKFLLSDDEKNYEFKKISLENSVNHFVSLQERLKCSRGIKSDSCGPLMEYMKNADEMIIIVINNAKHQLNNMIKDEKKYFNKYVKLEEKFNNLKR